MKSYKLVLALLVLVITQITKSILFQDEEALDSVNADNAVSIGKKQMKMNGANLPQVSTQFTGEQRWQCLKVRDRINCYR